MPEPEGNQDPVTPPEGFFGYGNDDQDLTIWLHERVRVQFAEHFSELYDTTPSGVIPVVVQLVMAAMSAAETPNEGDSDAQSA